MSRRWRSELVAVLGRGRCDVALMPGWFAAKPTACATGNGESAIAIAAALQALLANDHPSLPSSASLTVPDECVYYAMLPAATRWARRREFAAQHFAESLGLQDLHVRIHLVNRGRSWLAAAIEAADYRAWAQPFGDVGVELRSVRPALTGDLQCIASDIPRNAVLALVRQEGLMLLHRQRGALLDVCWERCVEADLERRIEAYLRTASIEADSVPVFLVVDAFTASGTVTRVAAEHRWQVLRAGVASNPAGVAS